MIYFINSTNRLYEDRDLNKIHDLLFRDGGIFNETGTIEEWKADGDLQVKTNSGLDLKVNPGSLAKNITLRGATETTLIRITTEQDVSVAENETGDVRVDAIVLRIDQSVIDDDEINTTGSNVVTIEAVTGSGTSALSDGAISTALDGDPFVRLADISVADEAVSILTANIDDTRVHAETEQAVIFRGERYRFIGLDADPSDAQEGDLWFSTGEEALKLKTSDSIISFTSSSFDIYSDGVSTQNVQGSDIISNTTENGQVSLDVFEFGSDPITAISRQQWWQIFTAPITDLGSILLKKGVKNDDENRGVKFEVYAVDGSDEPTGAAIDTFTYTFAQWDAIDPYTWFEMKLAGSYTASTRYGILCYLNTTNEPQDPAILVRAETTDANIENVFTNYNDLYGTSGAPEYVERDYALAFRLTQRETVDLGTSTNARIGQTFVAQTTTMKGLVLRKGDDNGTPTGDITFSLYQADENDEPTGEAIIEVIMTEEEWDAIDVDAEFTVDMLAGIGLGIKYIVYATPENTSDSNYRELWAAKTNNLYTNGQMLGYNGVSGWFGINYDLYFKILEGSENKLVKTLPTGKISSDLIDLDIPLVLRSSIPNIPSWTDEQVIKISPSGRYITMQYDENAPTFYVYEIVKRTLKFKGSFSASGADMFSITYGRTDNEMFLVGNENSTAFTRLWKFDPLVSAAAGTVYNYTTSSPTPDFTEASGNAYSACLYVHDIKTLLVAYGTDDYRKLDPDTLVSSGNASNNGMGYNNMRRISRYDKAGRYTGTQEGSNSLDVYTSDGDGTFTAGTSLSQVQIGDAYYWNLGVLDIGEMLALKYILVNATTSTSSAALPMYLAETIQFEDPAAL